MRILSSAASSCVCKLQQLLSICYQVLRNSESSFLFKAFISSPKLVIKRFPLIAIVIPISLDVLLLYISFHLLLLCFHSLYVSNAANEQRYYSATASEGSIYWEIRRSYLSFLGVGAWHNIIIIFMVLRIYFVGYIVTP